MTAPAPETADAVSYIPIGRVVGGYVTPVGMPLQTAASADQPLQVHIHPDYAAGLRDLEAFEFVWLLTHLHLASQQPLEVVPFLDTQSHGVFATRSPARPNRIGLSLVQLIRIDGTTLHCLGNDLVNDTPVLDIKPFVPRFDVRSTERIGWFAGRLQHLEATRADQRMTLPPTARQASQATQGRLISSPDGPCHPGTSKQAERVPRWQRRNTKARNHWKCGARSGSPWPVKALQATGASNCFARWANTAPSPRRPRRSA